MKYREFKSDLIQKFDIKTIILYFSICLLVILNSYCNRDGYLSPDSTYYLQLSKNLLLNTGPYIPDYQVDAGKTFFASWPLGYPVMIYFVSLITGLSVFWASKVLNLLLIGILLLLFRNFLRNNVHWAGLIFLAYSNISIFSFTWSEGPFIFFLVFVGFLLFKSVATGGEILWLIGLCLSGMGLFLMRYIGLISAGIIGIVALTCFFRQKPVVAIRLLIVASIQIAFACLYLYNNKLHTGFITGMPRSDEIENISVLWNQTITAFKQELILIKCGMPYLVTFAILILLGVYLYLKRKNKPTHQNGLYIYFLLSGLVYYAAIISLRWSYQFDPLNFRLLGPGTFMLILSLLTWLQKKPAFKLMKSSVLYLLVLLILIIHLLPSKDKIYRLILSGDQTLKNRGYYENTRNIIERYKLVEPKSVVIFGSDHLRYLRDDVIPQEIYEILTLENCMEYFTQKRDWHVYMNIDPDVVPEYIDKSFKRFIELNKDKEVVRLK